jgi:serine protease Do
LALGKRRPWQRPGRIVYFRFDSSSHPAKAVPFMRRPFFLLVLAMILGLAGLAGCARGKAGGAATPGQARIEAAIARVKPALVRIQVVEASYWDGRARKQQSSGSGFIISADGYAVTNHHVAGNAVRLMCTMADREEIPARLVGTDPLSDISVIQLTPAKARKFPHVAFADSGKLRVGDPVLAMGSPLALSQSVTEGIVSNTEMTMPSWSGQFKLDGEDVGSIVRWLAHDAQIFPGNSGGPRVDIEGGIVGVNEISFGLGGAIPSALAREVAQELIAKGEIERAFFGFLFQPLFKRGSEAAGVIVSDTIKGSPAERAGVKSGDRLLSIKSKGAALETDIHFQEELPPLNLAIANLPIGQPATLALLREGKPMNVELTPERRERVLYKQFEFKAWGVTARDLSIWTALEHRRPNKDGILITSINGGGPSGQAKPPLAADDIVLSVAGKPVKNIEEFRAATGEALKGQTGAVPLLVEFARDGQSLMTRVNAGLSELDDPGREVRKAWIPVATQVLTRELAEGLGLSGTAGVRVTQLYEAEDSTATMGLKTGDLIVELDGTAIQASEPHDVEVFPTMVRQYRIGAEVALTVLRAGQKMELKGRLSARPPQAREMARYRDYDFEFSVRDVSYLDRRERQLAEETRGALVSGVEDGGWAALAQLAPGDILTAIDNQPVRASADVKTILAQAKTAKKPSLVFQVRRELHTLYLEVEPLWEGQ